MEVAFKCFYLLYYSCHRFYVISACILCYPDLVKNVEHEYVFKYQTQ